MQKPFWWWQCSDGYIISLFFPPPPPPPPASIPLPPRPPLPPAVSPSLISLVISLDVKHRVYLHTPPVRFYIQLVRSVSFVTDSRLGGTQQWHTVLQLVRVSCRAYRPLEGGQEGEGKQLYIQLNQSKVASLTPHVSSASVSFFLLRC